MFDAFRRNDHVEPVAPELLNELQRVGDHGLAASTPVRPFHEIRPKIARRDDRTALYKPLTEIAQSRSDVEGGFSNDGQIWKEFVDERLDTAPGVILRERLLESVAERLVNELLSAWKSRHRRNREGREKAIRTVTELEHKNRLLTINACICQWHGLCSYRTSMKKSRLRLDIVEAGLLAGVVALMAFFAGRQHMEQQLRPFLSRGAAELQTLQDTFGASRNSRYAEEWIIRDFFNDERNGVFVDIGANHYQRESNSYYLEEYLGWRGLAVEPQTKFAADYAKRRPQTIFVPLFVSDKSDQQATMYVPANDLIASSDQSFVQREGGDDAAPVQVNTATLDDILDRYEIDRIDFLSIDVELHEPEVLSGFSINRFKPRLVCIESHAPVRQKILDYFASQGYALLGKYLRADSENLWFAAAGNAR